MENLEKLITAGDSLSHVNGEYLERIDWPKTSLGARDSWPICLTCFVNLLTTLPYPAAVFWGKGLAIVHNLAWSEAAGGIGYEAQGKHAHNVLHGEALVPVRSSIRGRTVRSWNAKAACSCWLSALDGGTHQAELLWTTHKVAPNHAQNTATKKEALRRPLRAGSLQVEQHLLIQAAGRLFLSTLEDEEETPLILSPLLDESGTRAGVLAQVIRKSPLERSLDAQLLRTNSEEARNETMIVVGDGSSSSAPSQKIELKETQIFQRFAELLPIGLAILDEDAEAVFVNDDFFKLTSNQDAKDFRSWPESIDPRDYDHVMSAYREAVRSNSPLRVEFRCVTPGDTEAWRLFLLRLLSDEADSGYICAVADITEDKLAVQAQERARKSAEDRKKQQEKFIDMVSHEIRNPLSAVLHSADEIKSIIAELQKQSDDSRLGELQDAADIILLCVAHQSSLVDDILSFSKLDSMMLSLTPAAVQPAREFANALKVFSSEFRAKSIDLGYAVDPSYRDLNVDLVMADLKRIKQVLINLVTNAIKFTGDKDGERHITVSMGATLERPSSYPPNVVFFSSEKEYHLDSTNSAEWGQGEPLFLMVAIKDTGIGISTENQAKLFERFRQATPKTQETYGGSGLGLHIARKLCQLHGGDIGVASKEGDGSTFGFFIKVRRAEAETDSPDGRPSVPINRNVPMDETTNPDKHQFSILTDRPHLESDRSGISTIENLDGDAASKKEARTKSTSQAIRRLEQHRSKSSSERIQKSLPKELQEGLGETTGQAERAGAPPVVCGDQRAQGLPAVQQQEKAVADKPSLLLVEDNLINQKVLRRQLHARGFTVDVAGNGQEAVKAVREKRPERYVCVLMDQEMPIKDGNTATREIRELEQQDGRGKEERTAILGVSANVRDAQREDMVAAGMDDVISKPFKVDDIVERIKGLIDR